MVNLFTNDQTVMLCRRPVPERLYLGLHVLGSIFSFQRLFLCLLDGLDIPLSTIIVSIAPVRVPGVYLTSEIFPETLFPMGLATGGSFLVSVVICGGLFLLLQRQDTT